MSTSLSLKLDSSGIVSVIYHNPRMGNSFGVEQAKEAHQFFRKNKKNIQGVVWSGHGRFFCAGGNLKDYKGMGKKQSMVANREIRAFLSDLTKLDVPTSAYINGDCFGGGVELLSAFDYVVASPSALIGLWQRKIGLSFGWGGGKRLAQRISIKKLSQLSLSTQCLTALECKKFGLVDEVRTVELGQKLAYKWVFDQRKLPKSPVIFFKSLILSKEISFFEKIWLNSEHKEILRKFKN